MKDRLRAVRKESGLNQSDFGEKLNLSKNFISLLEGGARNPSDRTIKDICRIFSISERWLLTGEGEMHEPRATIPLDEILNAEGLGGEEADLARRFISMYAALKPKTRRDILVNFNRIFGPPREKPRTLRLPAPTPSAPGFQQIQVYDVGRPAAGIGVPLEEGVQPTTQQYPAENLPAGTDFGVTVGGDSMEPEYPNGAVAFVHATEEVQDGDIILCAKNGEGFVKQLSMRGGQTFLHSLNEIYQDIPINAGDNLRVFGRVIGCYKPK